MILGHINARESRTTYSEQIQGAIVYCRDTNVSGMEEGCYPQDGDDFIVLINQRRTGSQEEKLPEVHREHAELQCTVFDREYMGFYPNRGDNEVLKDCPEGKNTLYYKENLDSGEVMLPLVPGSCGVPFPEDIHRPFCQVDGPGGTKKIVAKMGMSTLQDKPGFIMTGFVAIKHRLFSFDYLGNRLQQL